LIRAGRKPTPVAVFLFLLAWMPLRADEGMWLFNAPPTKRVLQKYHFELTPAWLDHLRLSTVAFDDGSGSFVSKDGLILTNQHVAASCIERLSTARDDYLNNGFIAETRAGELRCAGYEAEVLTTIADVTAKTKGVTEAGLPALLEEIRKACETADNSRCQVVALYSGAIYHLYAFHKYSDLRLVFAPEASVAFFGGNADNFEFPRYALDVAFLRAYENNRPAEISHYLRWSSDGVRAGDLIFAAGRPGRTSRTAVVSQLRFWRDIQYPYFLYGNDREMDLLRAFAAKSPENQRAVQEDLVGYGSGTKLIAGYLSGLRNPSLMRNKEREETALRANFPGNATNDPWARAGRSVAEERRIFFQYRLYESLDACPGTLCRAARRIVRIAAEREKPENERLPEYRGSALARMEQRLLSPLTVRRDLEEQQVTSALESMAASRSLDPERVANFLGGQSAAKAASRLIRLTRLDSQPEREALLKGGRAAVEASQDPLIVLMRQIDPAGRDLGRRYRDAEEEINVVGAAIARYRLTARGLEDPPDATGTLRLSYGTAIGYRDQSSPKKQIPPFTTVNGLYTSARQHDGNADYRLPARWLTAERQLPAATPVNFVSTADVIGGSSGSPVVNRIGELVGVVFDINQPALAGNFVYGHPSARAVQVDSRAITAALGRVYQARSLLNEILGGNRQ